MPSLASTLVLASLAFQQAAAVPAPQPTALQFVMADRALKSHASVSHNELTVTAGANEPYLSTATLTDHELDIEAIRAVRQWAFTPATMNGEPIRCRVKIILTFTLK
jgi:hypothetical protein